MSDRDYRVRPLHLSAGLLGILMVVLPLAHVAAADPPSASESSPAASPRPPDTPSDTPTRPATEDERRQAIRTQITGKTFIKIDPGSRLCSYPQLGRGYVVDGRMQRDGSRTLRVYRTGEKKPTLLQRKVVGYFTRAEGPKPGIDLTYDDPTNGVVTYRVYECKLNLK